MNSKVTHIIVISLFLVQSTYGSSNKVVASQAGRPAQPSKTEPAQTRQYKPGEQYKIQEKIQLRDGLTLKVVPGSKKSAEVLTSKLDVNETSFVLDLEFEVGKAAEHDVINYVQNEDAEKSDFFLQAGEQKIAPKGRAMYRVLAPTDPRSRTPMNEPLVARISNTFSVAALYEGKFIISCLFEPDPDQLKQRKKFIFRFEYTDVGENSSKRQYSFVIDVNN